jgi:zinc/manganese transport system substrate-binding protein
LLNIVSDLIWKGSMRNAATSPPPGSLSLPIDRRTAGPRGRVWMVVVAAALLTACASQAPTPADQPGPDGLAIVATTAIMGDIADNVATDDDRVSVLMDAGADPHTFEPSARQIAELIEADLVVANGAGLEEGLEDALDEAGAAGVPIFVAADHVDTLTADGDEHDGEGGDDASQDGSGDAHEEGSEDTDHGDSAVDPHIWMDPARMADVARALGGELGVLTDAPQAAADRAQPYAGELADLDRRIDEMLADIPRERRTLVSNHASLNYFADRYDLRIVGTVIPGVSTGGEPSARDIEALADVIRREKVPAIFTDNTVSSQLADTLARETGTDVEVVELYTGSLGTGDEAATYVDMLETDAQRISQALRP